MKLLAILLTLSVMLCVVQNGNAQDQWSQTDVTTMRLAPAAFPELPLRIIRHLEARGCTIPQSFGDHAPHNIIRGEFAKKGQADWAVLCSRKRVSSIVVYWGGSVRSVSEIARTPDRDYLQIIDGNGSIGFSRMIDVVERDFMLEHYREYGGPKPPRLNHQGINDAFVEKASVVHYYHRRRWLELPGVD